MRRILFGILAVKRFNLRNRLFVAVVGLVFASFAFPVWAQTTFTDVTNDAGVVGVEGYSLYPSWGDYDGDGYLDLCVVTQAGYPNLLYRNNGDGTFTNTASDAGIEEVFTATGTWADYDNDGWLDLYLAPGGLYHNNGDGTFTDVTSSAGIVIPSATIGVWGDYNNDGHVDLYVVGDLAPNYLYKNNGDGTFIDVTSSAGGGLGDPEQVGPSFDQIDVWVKVWYRHTKPWLAQVVIFGRIL